FAGARSPVTAARITTSNPGSPSAGAFADLVTLRRGRGLVAITQVGAPLASGLTGRSIVRSAKRIAPLGLPAARPTTGRPAVAAPVGSRRAEEGRRRARRRDAAMSGTGYSLPIAEIMAALDSVGLADVLADDRFHHVERADVVTMLGEFGRYCADVVA